MRKTKIICTLGPSTDKGDVLEKLMLSGMNVARLNFSHDTYEMGQDFCLTTRDVEGTKDIVSVTHKDLHKDIHVGSSILIDDGLVGLKVVAIKGQDIHCKVENGGTISNRKAFTLSILFF